MKTQTNSERIYQKVSSVSSVMVIVFRHCCLKHSVTVALGKMFLYFQLAMFERYL